MITDVTLTEGCTEEIVNLAIYQCNNSLRLVNLFANNKHEHETDDHQGKIRMLESSSCFVFKYTTA